MRGHPATVKRTGLGLDEFAIHVAGLHQRRIERQVMGKHHEGGTGRRITPGSARRTMGARHDIEISGLPFPFAIRRPTAHVFEHREVDILAWKVIRRWMTGFERANAAPGFGKHAIIEHHLQVTLAGLGNGGARIRPDTFLAGRDGVGFGVSGQHGRDASRHPAATRREPLAAMRLHRRVNLNL